MNTDWRTPIGNRPVGRTASGNANLDAIVLLGSRYSGIIYVGGPRSNVGRTVVGVGNPALNSFVFASGSWSGAHVLQVHLLNQFINLEGQTVGPGFFTFDLEGDGSVGNGDSGGPVAQAAADPITVNARGMIDAIDLNFETECEGIVADERRCASRAFHVNIGQIATGLGIMIKTV